jgi:hypothetical protein
MILCAPPFSAATFRSKKAEAAPKFPGRPDTREQAWVKQIHHESDGMSTSRFVTLVIILIGFHLQLTVHFGSTVDMRKYLVDPFGGQCNVRDEP